MVSDISIWPFVVISVVYLLVRLIFDIFKFEALKDTEWWIVGFPISLLSALTLVAPYPLVQTYTTLGVLHMSLSVIAAIFLMLSVHSKLRLDRFVIVLNLVSFGVSVIVLMMFFFNKDVFKKEKTLEIEKIETSFVRLEESFQLVATKIEKEKNVLGSGLDQLSSYINEQIEVLKEVEEKLRQKQEKLERYEKMLSISTEQRDAFMKDFNNSNSIWNFNWLASNIISALIGLFLSYIAKKFKGYIKQHKVKN